MRVAFSTFGCKINQFESDELKQSFRSAGNTVVPFEEQADIYVINTCTVTGKSDYQCRQAIRSAVRRGNGAQVIVTGCYAETNHAEIQKIAGVTKVVNNSDKQQIAKDVIFSAPGTGSRPILAAADSRTRPVIKIQDGCDAHCSYCIIPKARGSSRSIPVKDIAARFEGCIATGAPEIVLSGIHIGKYGKDIDQSLSLSSLVSHLVTKRGTARIRLSSIEPREITPDIIDLLGKGICRHLHIPLQSGDDNILQSMKRDYTSKFYRDTIERVAAQVPDVAIGADVIVGFPGESNDQFLNTLNLVQELPLTHLHVFSYSPRPGTKAADMPGRISETIKKSRNEQLREIALKKNFEFRKKFLDKKLPVVIERQNNASTYLGMSDNYIRISVQGVKNHHIGTEIPVCIDKVTESEIIGHVA